MSKTVSSTDAKGSFGALLEWTGETGDPVIIERRGPARRRHSLLQGF
jgi:hypothetical protein